ncbi:Reverse transcriptase zinc-binding domain [Senna tora]|uniref:Reverse transcriptase zinc-binding domain n=1 Tax=Senna tora TaxID=362788 RepID=A0A834WUX3_9FABA|nr:Reverse transcriptase zinc-binding domain [Senna tora]
MTAKPNSSPLWKQLCKASRVVTDNLGWRVGNGNKIFLNDTKWIPPDHQHLQLHKLSDLMYPGGFWDLAKVAQVYNSPKKQLVLDTAISHTNVEDRLIWNKSMNGEFTVKKAYELITSTTHTNSAIGFKWDRLWNLPLPQRILLFWWKNLNKGLPLKMNLARKGFQISTECPYGCDATETEEHIFKDCQFAKRVWFASRLNIRTEGISGISMTDWISQKISSLSRTSAHQEKETIMLLLSICWSLYSQRNHLLFQQGKDDVMECLSRAYKIVDDINGIDNLQQQDHFFKLDIPKKRRPEDYRTREQRTDGMVLNCNWLKDSRTRRKVFTISKQTQNNQMLLCSMVTADDQDILLAILRTIRLFLEDYCRHEMRPITFNIPCQQLLSHLRHKATACISYVPTTASLAALLLDGQLGGIL